MYSRLALRAVPSLALLRRSVSTREAFAAAAFTESIGSAALALVVNKALARLVIGRLGGSYELAGATSVPGRRMVMGKGICGRASRHRAESHIHRLVRIREIMNVRG